MEPTPADAEHGRVDPAFPGLVARSGALISVVVPTLQEGARIGALVRSVLPDVGEVVVVDGGSVDDTVARATEAGAVVVQAPRGRGAQLRAGALAARGQVLWFLHADATPPPGAAAAILRALADPAVVGGAFRLHTVEDTRSRFGRLVRIADLRSRYTGVPYGDQGIFARREAVEALGGVPSLALMEDIALSRGLRQQGRLVTLPLEMRVSARRFTEAPVRAFVTMWTFPLLFALGVDDQTLARWYGVIR